MLTPSVAARGCAPAGAMRAGRVVGLLAVLALAAGCEDSAYWAVVSPLYAVTAGSSQSSGGPAPVGADIGGKWGGRYVDQEAGNTEPVTISINQEGSNLVVRGHFLGVDHLMTGGIDEAGFIHVLDASDGQTWSTWTPATSSAIDLLDYKYNPNTYEGNDPLRVLELRR